MNQIFACHRQLKTPPTGRPHYYLFLSEKIIQKLANSSRQCLNEKWMDFTVTGNGQLGNKSHSLARGDGDEEQWAPRDSTADGCLHSRQHSPEPWVRTRPVSNTIAQRNHTSFLFSPCSRSKIWVFYVSFIWISAKANWSSQSLISSCWRCLKLHKHCTLP